MLETYAQVVRRPGALGFTSAGVVGRLPIAMESLGVVLLVSLTTGSYQVAGLLAATLALCASLLSPLTSRLADRVGQARVVPGLAMAQAAALIALVAAVDSGAPLAVQVLLAGLGGALQPNIGSMVRARWSAQLSGTSELGVAFALESILDELLFVIGPPLAAVLATTVAPGAALVASALLGVTGGLWLSAQRQSQPTPSPRTQTRPSLPLGASVPIIAGVFACLGVTFGALDLSTVAFANELGAPWLSGLIIAVIALGSMMGGLTFGARVHGRDLPVLLLLICGSAAVVACLLPVLHSPYVLVPACFLAGLTIAPSLICGYTIVENLVPAARLTESITWATSGIGIGVAVASSVSGSVIDQHGASAGFWIAVVGMALATAISAATLPALERLWRLRPAALDASEHDFTDPVDTSIDTRPPRPSSDAPEV